MEFNLSQGEGRCRVDLKAITFGTDLLVRIYNENAHVGAVAVGEYDFSSQRASVSVITRLGHKDDAVAQKAAYLICKSTRKTVCAVAGIHLDNITPSEITRLTENASSAIDILISQL